MTPQIRLQSHQLADLQVIRDLGADVLSRAIQEIKKLPPVPARPAEIQSVLSKVIGASQAGGEALLRQAMALSAFWRQLNISSEEVFAGLRSGLESPESRWSGDEVKKWISVSGLFKEFVELEVVQLSAKALDLSYEHSKLLQRARILTDIRPVYSHDAKQIRGTVISHTLLLRYDDTEGDHVLGLALDEGDIRVLIEQCKRALIKSETARNQLERNAGIPTIVPGENKNE